MYKGDVNININTLVEAHNHLATNALCQSRNISEAYRQMWILWKTCYIPVKPPSIVLSNVGGSRLNVVDRDRKTTTRIVVLLVFNFIKPTPFRVWNQTSKPSLIRVVQIFVTSHSSVLPIVRVELVVKRNGGPQTEKLQLTFLKAVGVE